MEQMTFRQQLIDNGFVYVPNFIITEHAKLFFNTIKNNKETKDWTDRQAPNASHCVRNFKPFLEMLCVKNMQVAELVGEMVLPTYAYSRLYKKGNILEKHVDKPACEISLSVHLQGDKEWPIYMEKPNGEAVGVVLKSGDAVLYLGCDTPHWRDAYDGEEYGQVFLHYVLSNGVHWDQYFNIKHELIMHKLELEVENG